MQSGLSFNVAEKLTSNDEKFRFSFSNIGIILLIIFSQYNIAEWGASFSYVAIPAVFLLLSAALNRFKFDKDSFIIFVLFGVYYISTAFSTYVPFGREMFSFFLFCVFFVLAVSHKFTLAEVRVFILIYILVSITASINICYQWLSGNYIQSWTKRSTFVLFGIKKDPNYTFSYISPAFVLSFLVLFFSKKKRYVVLSLINIIVTFFALLCSSSRAGMLAIVVSLIMIPLFCFQLKKRTRFLILLIVGFIVLAGYLFIVNFYNDYALARIFEDKDGAGRLKIWNYAFSVFRANPILGGGFNAGSSVSIINEGHSTHSIFLDILCDSGAVGMIAFLVFYVKNCIISNWDNVEILIILTAAFFIPMMFINGFNTTTFYFPMIFMAIFSRQLKENSYSKILCFSNDETQAKNN